MTEEELDKLIVNGKPPYYRAAEVDRLWSEVLGSASFDLDRLMVLRYTSLVDAMLVKTNVMIGKGSKEAKKQGETLEEMRDFLNLMLHKLSICSIQSKIIQENNYQSAKLKLRIIELEKIIDL